MVRVEFGIGAYITNGSSAGRVVEIVEKDPRWRCPGVRLANVGLEGFGGDVGMSGFVPDYLLTGWHAIPFEWTPVRYGGGLIERYVWSAGYTRLTREVKREDKAS